MPVYQSGSGKNLSAGVHAKRSKVCALCDKRVFGNGGWVAHNRGHVRRGEAVELVKHYEGQMTPSRLFLPVTDTDAIEATRARGYDEETGA